MKRSRTSRTMMITSTMALTIALGGGWFANTTASADPAAGTSAQKKNASPTTNSHTSKSSKSINANKGAGHGRYTDELVSALGVTVDKLKEARKAGSTIAEIAASNNVDVQTVIDKLVAAGKSELQQLSDGNITQTQYDKRIAGLNERVTDLVNGVLPEARQGSRGKRGEASGTESDSGSSVESTSTNSTDPA
ncbi:hypothetical protein ABIC22_002355 [Paenibacillus sp. PvP094]|uniref:hypothetical protein n=1 Tax=Paenibacillus sp. PvP094 TaxID=3156394 RepID=UPI003399505C